jgi:dolichyl-phosphate-mannose-protein mannosyltransferase
LLIFFFIHYSAVALLSVLAYVIGRTLTKRCAYGSFSEQLAFSTTLGIGAIGYMIFLLGLAHQLRRGTVLGCVIIAAGLCFETWKDLRGELLGTSPKSWPMWLAALGLVITVFWLFWPLPLYPPTGFDATMYHLPVAKLYAQKHSLVYDPYIRFSSFPQLNEMLFSLMLLFSDDISAQLTQTLMMFLIALAVYAWGKRLWNSEAGLWAAAIWLSNPVVLWLGTTAYVDLGVTLFICVGVYSFFNWRKTGDDIWLVLSAVFFGFAASSKYTALFPVCLFGTWLFYQQIRARSVRKFLLFVVVIAALAVPWYIRNFHYTGNPVFPTFSKVFGYGPWNSTEVHNEVRFQAEYGAGKTAEALLLLPWNLTFNQTAFTRGGIDLSQDYFFLLPLVVVFAFFDQKLRPLLALTVLLVLFWFFTFQLPRFLLPALSILSLLCAASVNHLVLLVPRLQRSMGYRLLAIGVALLLMLPAWKQRSRLSEAEAVPLNSQQRSAYLERKLRTYPAYDWLNRTQGSNYVLYALHDEQMNYFSGGQFEGDWFGPGRFAPIMEALPEPQELYKQLKQRGATFFLLNELGCWDLEGWANPELLVFMNDRFFQNHFKIVLARPYFVLFEIDDQSHPAASQIELLKNSSFEDLQGKTPKFWGNRGTPLTDASGQHSLEGKVAVRVDAQNWFSQRVPVAPDSIYVLRNATYATSENAYARMQINWLDYQGHKLVRADVGVVVAGPNWRRHIMTTMSPRNARWAEVYVSFQSGPEPIWFDDFSFSQMQYAF